MATTYKITLSSGKNKESVEVECPSIEAVAENLWRLFPRNPALQQAVITEIGADDLTPERHGVFRLGDGSRIA